MLEKTPKNSLRIPFIDAIWPDALFVYLYRNPRATMASMMRAWQSGKFKTYSNLPGWTGLPWSLVLVPGWRDLNGADLPQIVARQWAEASAMMLDELSALSKDRVRAVDYDDLVAAPQRTMKSLAATLGLNWDRELPAQLPNSRMTLTAPDPEKWREMEQDIESVWPAVAHVAHRARTCLERWRR
jgi:hypothetical protein